MSASLATTMRSTQNYVEDLSANRAMPMAYDTDNMSTGFDMEGQSLSPSTPVFEWVTTRQDFDALECDWNALFESSGQGNQVFQTFAWCWHWCNAFLNDGRDNDHQLSILTARQNGRLVLVWPLVIAKKTGLSVLTWLGEPVSQYGDVLLDIDASDTILQDAWAQLTRECKADYIQLRRVRADSRVAGLMDEVNATPSNKVEAPFDDLTRFKSYDEYAKHHCSSRARRNRGRLRRRLEERGKIEFRNIEQGPEAKAVTIRALELKRKWLVERGLASPALADPRTTKFFADVADKSDHQTGAVIHGVFCDDVLIAAEVAFQCKGHNALHIIVFDLEYEKVGAGVYLLEQTYSKAIENGTQVYDLLAPGDRYKLEWCDKTVDVYDWSMGLSLAGKVWCRVYLNFLRNQIKATWNRLPLDMRKQFKKVFEGTTK